MQTYARITDRILLAYSNVFNVPFPAQERADILALVHSHKLDANLALSRLSVTGQAAGGYVRARVTALGDIDEIADTVRDALQTQLSQRG